MQESTNLQVTGGWRGILELAKQYEGQKFRFGLASFTAENILVKVAQTIYSLDTRSKRLIFLGEKSTFFLLRLPALRDSLRI